MNIYNVGIGTQIGYKSINLRNHKLQDLDLVTINVNVSAGSDSMALRPILYSKYDPNNIIVYVLKGTAFSTSLTVPSKVESKEHINDYFLSETDEYKDFEDVATRFFEEAVSEGTGILDTVEEGNRKTHLLKNK